MDLARHFILQTEWELYYHIFDQFVATITRKTVKQRMLIELQRSSGIYHRVNCVVAGKTQNLSLVSSDYITH